MSLDYFLRSILREISYSLDLCNKNEIMKNSVSCQIDICFLSSGVIVMHRNVSAVNADLLAVNLGYSTLSVMYLLGLYTALLVS